MENKKISILGCGWYGLALGRNLASKGYNVKGSTTSEAKLSSLKAAGIEPYLVNIDETSNQYNKEFFNCDILLIAISPKSRSPLVVEYPEKIKTIANAAEKFGVKHVILISSSGIYQDGNFIVDETITPQPVTESGNALLNAENILKSNTSFTSTIIRFTGLIGPGRDLSKHFSGKKDIPNGLAPINLIHLTDCLGLTLAIIEQNAFGKIYHGVSPSHLSKQDFYTKSCIASGCDKPDFLNELLNWKQVESKNVPEVLAYEYVYTIWDKYFEELKVNRHI